MLKIPIEPKLGYLLQKRSIRDYVVNWNSRFPVDKWWRLHYDVPFGSPQHLSSSFLYMSFEYIEFVEFRLLEIEQRMEKIRQAVIKNNELFTQQDLGDKEIIPMGRKEIDEEFANLNLEDFNDVNNQS